MIDLYLNAITFVATDSMIPTLVFFVFTFVGAGLGLSWVQPLLEELNKQLSLMYWHNKELTIDGPFRVPEYMMEWPTLQELQESEFDWDELVMEAAWEHMMEDVDDSATDTIISKLVSKALDELGINPLDPVDPVNVENATDTEHNSWEPEAEDEDELDELWDRMFKPTALLNQYMRTA